ncbi:short-chain dehydrogenase/reductase [Frankia sp. CcI49]|uniref:SDR family NAD(P)-dependent oxidoreductase n=1 Tax=Frankia sp. CcI49 TaxID=1745382 RepID=UPI0009755B72|nr:SDR family NAD(P)-dependent oxidoreductase [Frankia sp. CcI49]ONH55543.1 short-chain dehydrogenase/reductase [Frankia sp. CcI49]
MAEELGARRTAVVVGTGPDIGRACAVAMAADGAHVVCFDHDESAAVASAQAVTAAGGTAISVVVDVTDRASVQDAFAEVAAERGHVDVLVNVVGGSAWSLSAETSDEEWDRVFALNLRQQWIVAQECLRVMTAGRGAIVAIASVSGLAASTRHGAYGAAKAGLISLVRTLAIENADRGIRVNAVAPGATATVARAGDDHLTARIPLGRRGRPADIGAAVAFLASSAADYITGQVLVVDGGVGIRHALIDL